MLVLSRKIGQLLYIGPVTLTVLSITRSRVKLGIVAPDDTEIVRSETESPKSKPSPAPPA